MFLPSNARFIADARDFSIIDYPLPDRSRLINRLGVLWDKDRDARILEVLFALSCRDLRARVALVALAEISGIITAWGYGIDHARMTRSLQEAADCVLLPHDRWSVNGVIEVPMKDGFVDLAALEADHPLHKFPPKYALGVKRPR